MKKLHDRDTANFFQLEEFACRCGCGRADISPELVTKLNAIRGLFVCSPMIVNCGVRCATHNAAVGGSRTSSHMTGFAVDIHAPGGAMKRLIVEGAVSQGIRQIGVYKTFLHLGDDPGKPETVFRGDR